MCYITHVINMEFHASSTACTNFLTAEKQCSKCKKARSQVLMRETVKTFLANIQRFILTGFTFPLWYLILIHRLY